jgi:hypothetical protein
LTVKKNKIIFGEKSYSTDKILFINEKDLELPHGDDYKIAINEIKKVQESEINNSQIFTSFRYNDVDLWWFVYQSLIPHYKKIVNFVSQLINLIDQIEPDIIEIKGNYEKVNLIKKICYEKNIKCKYSQEKILKKTLKDKGKKLLQKKRYHKITKSKITKRKKTFLKYSDSIPNTNNKIIFCVPTIYRRKIFDYKTQTTKNGEYIQQSLINGFDNDEIVGIDLDYTFKGEHDILEERMNEEMKWFPMESLLSEIDGNHHKKSIKIITDIINSKEFQKKFTYSNIPIWDEIKGFFEEILYEPHIPYYMTLIDSLEIYFATNRPRAVFVPYETGPYALAIISLCKKFKIKTIGVQHGYIYDGNPMYVFGKYINNEKSDSFPFPDEMLLFGKSAKNILKKCSYPDERLNDFGNPAFFNLETMKKSFDKKKLFEKYNIPINSKVILFTSGKLQKFYTAHGKYDYDEQIWHKLIQISQKNNDLFIILKPHPQEENVTVYKEIMKNISNVIITQDSISELIQTADIVISVFSSTMIDALCFNKPVIKIKFANEKNSIFDLTDVVIETKLEKLSNEINKILTDKNYQKSVSNSIKEFVKEQYGIPEQNISRIITNIIEKN